MSKALEKLEAALQRLTDGKALKVLPPYKINNDTVALEAGLKRGSVNKQRPELANLLVKIKEAEQIRTGKSTAKEINANKKSKKLSEKEEIQQLKAELSELKNGFLAKLSENNSLIYHNHLLQRQLKEANKSLDDYIIKFSKIEK